MPRRPDWWPKARRLYRLRFMNPDGTRMVEKVPYGFHKHLPVRLTMRDVARIMRLPPMTVQYCLSPRTRESIRRYEQKKRKLTDEELREHQTSKLRKHVRPRNETYWAKRWREEYRRERRYREVPFQEWR